MDQDETWRGGRPRPWPHCVRWGPRSPLQKGAQPLLPIFGPSLLWPSGWKDQDATWLGDRPWRRRRCYMGTQIPVKGAQPPIVTHVYCGQAAGWIKMPLGTKVGLHPGDIVLDGDPAFLKGAQPPIFGPCLLWPDGRPSQLLLSTCFYPINRNELLRSFHRCKISKCQCLWMEFVSQYIFFRTD